MCTCECFSDIFLVVLSVLFPPLPVWIRRGVCSCDSLINIVLCILGYLPGLIHSWYIIAKYPPYTTDTRIYYVYQSAPSLENGQGVQQHHHDHHHTHCHDQTVTSEPHGALTPSYGSTNNTIRRQSSEFPPQTPPAYSELPLSK